MELLAPNGKPSKLTAEQYRLVRTSAFKNWFGDWENSPETASKIVDENGEPLVVYHGTDYDFNTFEKNINETDYGYFGIGFYFTQSKNLSKAYGSKTIEVFLNSKTPYIYNGKADSIELKFGQELGVIPKIDEDGDVIQEEYDFGNSKWFNKRYVSILTLRITKSGYDGVIVKEIDEIVVYNSNQIKLADGTNTTFDANNPDMRYAYGGDLKIHFDTLEEYQKWISDKIQEQGKEVFIKSEEYRVAYPRYRKLWNEKHNYIPQKRVIKNKIGFIAMAFDKNSNVSNDLHDPIEEKFTSFTQGKIRAKELAKTIFKKYKKIDHIIFDFLPLDEYGEITYGKNNPSPITYNRDYTRFHNGGTLTMKKPTLLAPNGQPSNLAPEQYRLVRTPAFKKWFGDWENSPESASKIVDENGEPLEVYHRTEKKFTIFDKEKLGNKSGWETAYFGFYFSNKNQKGYYGKKVMKCFLSIKNPYFIETETYSDFDYDYKRFDSLNFKNNDGVYIQVKRLTFDEKSYKHFVAFEPNQIKLADGTNTTFDANNPDIRYKEGGATKAFTYTIGGL